MKKQQLTPEEKLARAQADHDRNKRLIEAGAIRSRKPKPRGSGSDHRSR